MVSSRQEELDDIELPSYEDVLREDEQRLNSGSQQRPPPQAPRPTAPSRPPRRSDHHSSRPSGTSSVSSSRPSRVHSTHSTTSSGSAARPTKPIPWVYPRGFHCPKCANTGYKLKNGKSCRSCWRRFAPINNGFSSSAQVLQTPSHSSWGSSGWYSNPSNFAAPFSFAPSRPPAVTTTTFGGGPPMGSPPPLYVKPGDPRLGGVLCGECRGTGRVSFFLDEDLCPLCRGLGRLIG